MSGLRKGGGFRNGALCIGLEYCIADRLLVEIAYVDLFSQVLLILVQGGFRELGFSIRTKKFIFLVAYGVGLRSDR